MAKPRWGYQIAGTFERLPDVDVLAGHAIGVRTVLIRHGRPVADDVLRRAWRVVETPTDAYALLRQAAGSVG
jgi:hypothetical protein